MKKNLFLLLVALVQKSAGLLQIRLNEMTKKQVENLHALLFFFLSTCQNQNRKIKNKLKLLNCPAPVAHTKK